MAELMGYPDSTAVIEYVHIRSYIISTVEPQELQNCRETTLLKMGHYSTPKGAVALGDYFYLRTELNYL